MQLDVVDHRDSTRVGILECDDKTPVSVGDKLKVYADDPKKNRLFFSIIQGGRSGFGVLKNGNLKTGDQLLVEEVRR